MKLMWRSYSAYQRELGIFMRTVFIRPKSSVFRNNELWIFFLMQFATGYNRESFIYAILDNQYRLKPPPFDDFNYIYIYICIANVTYTQCPKRGRVQGKNSQTI